MFRLSAPFSPFLTPPALAQYTESGLEVKQYDGRGNVTTTIADIAGRTISVTDAVGATTTTVYDITLDQPAVVTDALGNTACYKYDQRGRKIAEWGTGVQPVCFGYDEADNLVSLTTFRGTPETNEDGSPGQSGEGAAAGDVTTWAFNPVTGLEISKTYADNTTVVKTYDAYNRLATETDARGNVKTHFYEHARGLHLGTAYTVVNGTAATTERSFTYNHLGQITQLVDDSGTRTFAYTPYGERETDSLVVDGDIHLITENRDSFGRSTGYTYAKNGTAQHTVITGYGTDGRISSTGFTHGGVVKQFGYEYLSGSNLLHKLTKPNGMTLTQTYETTRDLLTGMAYHRGSTLVAQREYTYDILGRPTARNTARQGRVVNDSFAHNSRSELEIATVNGANYEYVYDNIGNREFSLENNTATMYEANELNQYTSISENGGAPFVPQFDADGNQTLIKTDTGIWSAVYNAENRPVSFTNSENNTVVECAYDSMGRRAYKKVSVNGSVTLHQRYIYRGYLQIACIDLTRSHHPALWYITWDATQPVATRPLAIQINGTWYTYGWDLTKNICELYSTGGTLTTAYTYSPFGKVTVSGSLSQPIQWSSEVWDGELGLVYYNWRYYNAANAHWLSIDLILVGNRYNFTVEPVRYFDMLGLLENRDNYIEKMKKHFNDEKLWGDVYDAFYSNKPIKAIVRHNQCLHIDADGCPRAYHPENIGIDYNANAGIPRKKPWKTMPYGIAHNGTDGYIQTENDPYPGYYVSTTSLVDPSKEISDPRRYVDAENVPYVVYNRSDRAQGIRPGDMAAVSYKDENNHLRVAYGIVADYNARSEGEVSMKMAEMLGIASSPKRGGCGQKKFTFVLLTNSRFIPSWGGISNTDIQRRTYIMLMASILRSTQK